MMSACLLLIFILILSCLDRSAHTWVLRLSVSTSAGLHHAASSSFPHHLVLSCLCDLSWFMVAADECDAIRIPNLKEGKRAVKTTERIGEGQRSDPNKRHHRTEANGAREETLRNEGMRQFLCFALGFLPVTFFFLLSSRQQLVKSKGEQRERGHQEKNDDGKSEKCR